MTDSLRIAITHPYSWPEVRRGAERIIVDMARSLSRLGHDVTVLSAGSASSDEMLDGYRLVRYRSPFESRTRRERWFGARVMPALIRGRYDVVHSMMPFDGAAAVRTRRLGGHVVLYDEMGNPSAELIDGRFDERPRRRLIRSVDVYACMSPFSQRFLVDDFGRRGVLIPGGVRVENARPGPRSPHPTILFSGALHRPEKNVALLLAATAIVAETRPDVEVLLSGPGDPSPFIDAAPDAARTRTTVLPVGEPDGQADRYASAWVTCLPTEWDSFGLVVIESLANGTPAVVGPIGGPTDTVTGHEGVGVAAAELTPESLAEALLAGLALAEDPSTAARCAAAGASYDWDTVLAPLLVDLYRRAMAGDPEVLG
mgnify:FL=1